MAKTNWSNLVGKRCLVTNSSYLSKFEVYEITVQEVSPKGRVKVRYNNGATDWIMPEEGGLLTLVEVLEEK